MDQDERVFIVMAEDRNGDGYLFSTESRERAEAKLAAWTERFGNARTNWSEAYAPLPGLRWL